MVKEGKEASLWLDVTPDTMSEEERNELENVVIRHAPAYRSDVLDRFIDSHVESESKGIYPWIVGLDLHMHEKPIPAGYKKWIVKKDLRAGVGDNNREEAVIESD